MSASQQQKDVDMNREVAAREKAELRAATLLERVRLQMSACVWRAHQTSYMYLAYIYCTSSVGNVLFFVLLPLYCTRIHDINV